MTSAPVVLKWPTRSRVGRALSILSGEGRPSAVDCMACARPLLPSPFDWESYTYTATSGQSWTWDIGCARTLTRRRSTDSRFLIATEMPLDLVVGSHLPARAAIAVLGLVAGRTGRNGSPARSATASGGWRWTAGLPSSSYRQLTPRRAALWPHLTAASGLLSRPQINSAHHLGRCDQRVSDPDVGQLRRAIDHRIRWCSVVRRDPRQQDRAHGRGWQGCRVRRGGHAACGHHSRSLEPWLRGQRSAARHAARPLASSATRVGSVLTGDHASSEESEWSRRGQRSAGLVRQIPTRTPPTGTSTSARTAPDL